MQTRRRPVDNQEWIQACRDDSEDDSDGERRKAEEGQIRRK